jgi:Ca2+-binding EF-hand superfamily protein
MAAAAAMLSTHALGADRGPQPDLTRQQALVRADALFERFDLDHDGIVTRDEARQVGTKLALQRTATGIDPAPGIGGHTLKFLEQAFAGAPSVTRREFERAMLAHFDAMDVNHDGVLTAAERAQTYGAHARWQRAQ